MILKSDLYAVINMQQKLFFTREFGVKRTLKIDFEEENTELVVINGIKRSGKTTYLYQLYKSGTQDVFYVNFKHPGLYNFDYNDIFKLDEIITASGNMVLFFDEVTTLNQWQRYVRHKLDEGYKVVVTATNSEIFNEESALSLTGSYVIKNLMPFSYMEFCESNQLPKDTQSVSIYMQNGGFPGHYGRNHGEYLSQLFDDIVVREIGLRFGVRDLKSLKRMALHLLLHIGETITGNQLKSTLGIKTTSTTVDYLNYLENGFLMYYLPRFSYSIRKQMVNPRKVYVADPGFYTANTFSIEDNKEQLLENLVYLTLRNRYSELYYYSEKSNCDFIAFGKNKALKAIQVCANVQQDNLETELNGLFEAMEHFEFDEGTLVTMNQKDRFERQGKLVELVPFYEF